MKPSTAYGRNEGFCVWPSDETDYTLTQSPYRDGKGDIVGEVADACREFELAFGFYLSPFDLNAPMFGETPKYNAFYQAQLRELLTRYGKVFHVWFDGAGTDTPGPSGGKQTYDWAGFHALVRELQPGATMFSDAGPDVRWVGNESGLASETNWCMIDRETYWATEDGVTAASLEVELGAATKLDVIELQEQIALGQRVSAFTVEAFVDGAWQQVAEGTTIGYKRLLRFDDPVTASKIRLTITDARSCPTISQLGVYTQPRW